MTYIKTPNDINSYLKWAVSSYLKWAMPIFSIGAPRMDENTCVRRTQVVQTRLFMFNISGYPIETPFQSKCSWTRFYLYFREKMCIQNNIIQYTFSSHVFFFFFFFSVLQNSNIAKKKKKNGPGKHQTQGKIKTGLGEKPKSK